MMEAAGIDPARDSLACGQRSHEPPSVAEAPGAAFVSLGG
jgi:hypothetical protein